MPALIPILNAISTKAKRPPKVDDTINNDTIWNPKDSEKLDLYVGTFIVSCYTD